MDEGWACVVVVVVREESSARVRVRASVLEVLRSFCRDEKELAVEKTVAWGVDQQKWTDHKKMHDDGG